MGMFGEVLCNNNLFGAHRGETHQTKSLQPMIGGALKNYEITPAGRLEFLEYVVEHHSGPDRNADEWERLGTETEVFTGGRGDMNYHGWLELSCFGRVKFTDGVMVAFEPEPAEVSDEALQSVRERSSDDQLAADLGGLGYPGYGYLGSGSRRDPAEVLLDALDRDDLDARVVEGLLWVPLRYPHMNWSWLVAQAKLCNCQNRLGFVVNLSARAAVVRAQRSVAESLYKVVAELRKARLVKNDTLCQASWPPSMRRYAHEKRSRVASYWNLDTQLTEKNLVYEVDHTDR